MRVEVKLTQNRRKLDAEIKQREDSRRPKSDALSDF